jgi:hypothetical protein
MKKKVDWHFLIPLIFIILIGFSLRVGWLGKYPIGFHSQEALLGYRGKLLADNLVDETGRKLPLIFTSFEGYQLPMPSYLVAISVKIFGLNEWAVRFPLAVMGCLGLMAFLGILYQLFPKKKWIVFWSVLVMAINPWSVFLSRTTSEIFLLFNLFLLISWLFLVLVYKRYLKALTILLIGIFLIFLSITISYWRLPAAKQDFINKNFGFFTNLSILNSINQMRGENLNFGDPILGKLFYNKTFYALKFFEKTAQQLNPQFYFAAGEGNPFHGLTNFGPILVVFLPLFLFGIWHLFKTKELSKYKKWLLILFFFAILLSAFDSHIFNQEKLVFAFPVMAILIGYAINRLKKYQVVLLIVLLIFNFSFVFYDAFRKEPLRAQEEWQFGVKQMLWKLEPLLDNYDKVFLTDSYSQDIGSQFLFYFNYPQEKLRLETNLQEGKVFYRQWLNQIGKIRIGQKESWQIDPGEKGVFVILPKEKELLNKQGFCHKEINQVFDLSHKPLFLFCE